MKQYISLALTALAISAQAQYNQSIAVEGKYKPDVFKLERINSFPKLTKMSIESEALLTERKGIQTPFAPSLLPMPATGWNDTRTVSEDRGYLTLGSGSWLNSTLSAGYRIIQNSNADLGVSLQHNSTSLWEPKVSKSNPTTKMWRYDEVASLYGGYTFQDWGRLQASADLHLGYFNYYGFNPIWQPSIGGDPIEKLATPNQHIDDIATRISWKPASKPDDISWNIGAGYRRFAYRNSTVIVSALANSGIQTPLPQFPNISAYECVRMDGGVPAENNFSLNGNFHFPLQDHSALGMDLNSNYILYSQGKTSIYEAPRNYGLISLNPYYRFQKAGFNFKVGGNIDLFITNRKKTTTEPSKGPQYLTGLEPQNYSLFHITPQLDIDWSRGRLAAWFNLKGGTELHTLASSYELDYWQMPTKIYGKPTYIPIDAELGLRVEPITGLSIGARLDYRMARNQYLGGWSMAALNYADCPMPGLPEEHYFNYNAQGGINMQGIALGASLNYKYNQWIELEADGSYAPQRGTIGFFNGYDRPQYTASASLQTNPWSSLKLKVGYDFRGKRAIYAQGEYATDYPSTWVTTLESMPLPDISQLNAGASYDIFKNLNVWVQANNILNRREIILPDLPSQGVSVTAGFGFTF